MKKKNADRLGGFLFLALFVFAIVASFRSCSADGLLSSSGKKPSMRDDWYDYSFGGEEDYDLSLIDTDVLLDEISARGYEYYDEDDCEEHFWELLHWRFGYSDVLAGMENEYLLEELDRRNFPDWILLLDEAGGNAAATELLFEFAEEIGYDPSAVLGPFVLDAQTNTVHDTDSSCVESIPYERIRSLAGASDEWISENAEYCPVCTQEDPKAGQ